MKSLSERFLDAFITIESAMNQRLKGDRRMSFTMMVHQLAKQDSAFARFKIDLEEFAQLRNAIVHERIDNQVIAEPHEKVVLQIETIADILTRPLRVEQMFLRTVHVVSRDQSLDEAIRMMSQYHHAKLPVYNKDQGFVGLLTSELILEYLHQHLSEMQACWPNATVLDVLKTDVKERSVEFIPRHFRLLSVLDVYERSLQSGRRLNALIITQDGASNQKPLGFISISDLPKIYQSLNLTQR